MNFNLVLLVTLSIILLTFTFASSISEALRIGIFTVEESGHLLPMTAIAHEAVKKGHTIDIFLPNHAIKATKGLFPSSSSSVNFIPIIGADQLVGDHEDNFTLYQKVTESDTLTSLTIVNEQSHGFFKTMIPGLRQTIENTYGKGNKESEVDVILTDYALNNLMLALHRTIPCIKKKPLVYLWPLTLSLPTTSMSYIPALSSGFTLEDLASNPLKRLGNYFLQRLLIFGQRKESKQKLQELMIVSEQSSSSNNKNQLTLEEITKKVEDQLASEIQSGDFDTVNEILVNHFVITPSIFGLDLAQPLCPNIRAVGFLNPPPAIDNKEENKQQKNDDVIPSSEWNDWLENDCSSHPKGAIYVNMGSVAILPTEWLHGMERILTHLAEKEGLCVIWKMRLREQRRLRNPPAHLAALSSIKKEISSGALDSSSSQASSSSSQEEKENKKYLTQPKRGNKLAIVARIPFAPKLLLSATRKKSSNNKDLIKNYISTFVSHCGDTSVYESVEATVPIVGIPLFADQPDMCARIVDAGVGVSIDKRTLALASSSPSKNEEKLIKSSPLYKAIQTVINDRSPKEEESKSSMVSKMNYIKRVGESMGGASEAVRVIELATMHQGETIKHFTCSTLTTKLPWYLRDNWDICIELGLLVLPAVLMIKSIINRILGLFFGGDEGKKKVEKRNKAKKE